MVSETTAKAPGKILWIGGYSVLERPNVSYVTAVKAFVNVHVKPNGGNSVELNAPQLGMNAKGSISSEGKLNIEVPKELILLKTSVEMAARYSAASGAKLEGFAVDTKSDDAFSYTVSVDKIAKSGLGSSAALTVATVAAVMKAFGLKANKQKVHKLAQIAHSIATGKVGSGFDIASACYGSILYTRYSPELITNLPAEYSNKDLLKLVKKKWDHTVEKLPLPKGFEVTFANFVGESMITTASLGSVSEFKKNDPQKYNDIMRRINDENLRAVETLQKIVQGHTDLTGAFKNFFENGRLLTKELGVLSNVAVEPDDCTKLIEESKQNGAFVAKLPGAGGKDAISAISITKDDQKRLRIFWKKKKELALLKIKISKKGFDVLG